MHVDKASGGARHQLLLNVKENHVQRNLFINPGNTNQRRTRNGIVWPYVMVFRLTFPIARAPGPLINSIFLGEI